MYRVSAGKRQASPKGTVKVVLRLLERQDGEIQPVKSLPEIISRYGRTLYHVYRISGKQKKLISNHSWSLTETEGGMVAHCRLLPGQYHIVRVASSRWPFYCSESIKIANMPGQQSFRLVNEHKALVKCVFDMVQQEGGKLRGLGEFSEKGGRYFKHDLLFADKDAQEWIQPYSPREFSADADRNWNNGKLTGVTYLQPGQWRVSCSPTYMWPYECEAEVEIKDRPKQQHIILKHTLKERLLCRLHVLRGRSDLNWGGLEIEPDRPVGVRMEGSDCYLQEHKFRTDENGRAEFVVWEGTKDVTLNVDTYRTGKRQVTVPVEKLKEGYGWELPERPVMATMKVLFRTERGLAEFSQSLGKALYDIRVRRADIFVWRTNVYFRSGPDKRKVKDPLGYWPALADSGRFDPDRSVIEYRNLKPGTRYITGDKISVYTEDRRKHFHHLIKGGRLKFSIEKPGLSLGTVIAATDTYPVNVTVQDAKGDPVERAVVVWTQAAARGEGAQPRRLVSRTDENGEARRSLIYKGEYELTAKHPEIEFDTVTLRIPGTERVTIRAKGARKPTHGTLHLRAQGADGKPLHLNARIAIYSPQGKDGLIRSAVPRHGISRVRNLKPGRYLLVMETRPAGASRGAFAAEGMRFTVKECRIKVGQNRDHIRESKGIRVSLDIEGLPASERNEDAIVSVVGEWRGVPYVTARSRLGGGRQVSVIIPAPGRYWVAVGVPGPKTKDSQELSDRFAGALIYYSDPVNLGAGKAQVKIKPSTRQPARKGSLRASDFPGFQRGNAENQ
jgi:hypothetical protein